MSLACRIGASFRSRRAWLLACLLGIAVTPSVSAQPVPRTGSPCPCRLVVTEGVRLGTTEGDGILDADASSMARLPDGRMIVTLFSPARATPMVFDSTGRYMGALGRCGAGPGEFRFARFVRAHGDSVYVSDMTGARLSVFSADLSFVRSVQYLQVGMAGAFEVVRGGGVVANVGSRATRDQAGIPLVLYDRHLGDRRLLEADDQRFRSDRPQLSGRRLTRSRDGGFWAAHVTAYVLERYDSTGARTRVLRPERAWFTPHDGLRVSFDEAPGSLISWIHEDGDGRLWVLSMVRNTRWRSAVGWTLPRGGRSALPIIERLDDYHDTMIEIFPPDGEEPIVSQRFPEVFQFLLDGDMLATRVEDANGDYFIKTWLVRLMPTTTRSD
jgi:hypothetical protein